jgi:hypothetical protein
MTPPLAGTANSRAPGSYWASLGDPRCQHIFLLVFADTRLYGVPPSCADAGARITFLSPADVSRFIGDRKAPTFAAYPSSPLPPAPTPPRTPPPTLATPPPTPPPTPATIATSQGGNSCRRISPSMITCCAICTTSCVLKARGMG